jgi:CrcB protein
MRGITTLSNQHIGKIYYIYSVKILVYIALGGALGAICRYGIGLLLKSDNVLSFPYHTFSINILGCLMIGLASSILITSNNKELIQHFLIIGILGGFTTFSSFSLESIFLIQNGKITTALSYILLSNFMGLLAAFGGFQLHQIITKA